MSKISVRLESGVLSVWGVPNRVRESQVREEVLQIIRRVAEVSEPEKGSGEVIIHYGTRNSNSMHSTLVLLLKNKLENEKTRIKSLPRFSVKGKVKSNGNLRHNSTLADDAPMHRPGLRSESSNEESAEAAQQVAQ